MQAPTHVLTGVLIHRALRPVKSPGLRYGLIFLPAAFSHVVLDRLARLTYHPPEADFSDPFWLGYHLTLWVGFLVLLLCFGKTHKTGIAGALLPDFDWLVIHGGSLLGFTLPGWQAPLLHQAFYRFLDGIPGLAALRHLPDFTHHPAFAVCEMLLIAGLLVLLWVFSARRGQIPPSQSAR